MSAKVIKPSFRETMRYGRRSFLRQAAFAAGGLGVMGHFAPNVIINSAYAGTVVILDRGGDKRVSVSNGSFARPFDVGTWTTLRFGMRVAAEFAAALTSLTPRLVIGLCSGSTNQVFDATTTNFVGVRSTAATWGYLASVPDILYHSTTTDTLYATKRVGSTWTDGDAFNNTAGGYEIFRASESSAMYMHMLEITKGSPNYTLSFFYSSTSAADVSRDTFLAQMVAVSPSISGHLWRTGKTIATSEGAGTFDHVLFGWDRHEATFEVSDLAVVKMAA